MAAKLSDDILSIIFLKLPIKSLLRCRSVCKSWRQLLCDPHFVKMHLNHLSQHHHKLLLRNSNCFYSLDYETSHRNAVPRDFPLEITLCKKIWGSCNGLVCVPTLPKTKTSQYQKLVKVVLWNPSTGDYKILPLADPSVNDNQIVGFGYDSSINDYKIVRIIPYYFVKAENEPGKAYCGLQVDMYSLKTNSWKIIRDLPRRDVVRHAPLIFNGEFGGRVSVSMNKSIYWLLGSKIIGFDLKNEKFKELSWPCNMQPDFRKRLKSLSVMGGYLFVHYIELDSKKFVVWKLKENDNGKEEWIKLKIASIGEASISWSPAHNPVSLWTRLLMMLPSADPSIDDLQISGFGFDSFITAYRIVRIITHDFVKVKNE
ncbi:hypothetical protein LguiA_025965 [Lonicera macranthoides]